MQFIDNFEVVGNVANMSLVFLSFFEGLGWQVDQRCLPKKWSVLQSCLVRFSCWRSQVTWWWDVLSQAELLKDHVCMGLRLVLLNGSASSYSRRPHSFPWTVKKNDPTAAECHGCQHIDQALNNGEL